MSTLTTSAARTTSMTRGPLLTFGRVLRSEFLKQRTIRSVTWTLAATFVVLVGFGMLAAQMSTSSGSSGAGPDAGGPVLTVLAGANFAVLIVSVLGVLAGAREYSSGMIRATLAAVPARLPVLWAKVIAFVGVTAPIVVIGTVLAFFAGMGVLRRAGASTAAWSDPGVARVVLGIAAYLVALGVIGLCLGVLLRHIGLGLGVLIGGLLFLPALATALLPHSWDAVLKYLPSSAADSLTSVAGVDGLLTPAQAGLVLAGWVLLAVLGAAVALRRRDA
jgi:ABC-type transport system involved in multi-copper enzyme maturation permease subunit